MPFTVEMTGTNEISPAVLQTLGASFNVPLQKRLYDQISLTQMANSVDQTQFKFGRINKIALPAGGVPLLQEYEDPDSTPLTGSSTTFDAAEMGVVVTTTARAEAISGGNLGRQAAAAVGLNAAESLDLYAASVLGAGTNAIFAGAGTLAGVTAADIMSPALMNRAYARLAKNRATKNADGTFNAMLTTDQILDLKNNAQPGSWTDVYKYAQPDEVMSGEVGKAFGFRIIEINLLPTVDGGAGGAVDVSKAVFFGANALGQGITTAPRLGINFNDKMNRFAHYSWYANMVIGIIDQSSVFVVNTATTVVA